MCAVIECATSICRWEVTSNTHHLSERLDCSSSTWRVFVQGSLPSWSCACDNFTPKTKTVVRLGSVTNTLTMSHAFTKNAVCHLSRAGASTDGNKSSCTLAQRRILFTPGATEVSCRRDTEAESGDFRKKIQRHGPKATRQDCDSVSYHLQHRWQERLVPFLLFSSLHSPTKHLYLLLGISSSAKFNGTK